MNLSDLAAKGAAPLGFLLAIALPKDFSEDWLAGFARGLGEDADALRVSAARRRHGFDAGSDQRSRSRRSALVPHGTMVKRSGAKVGDHVFVSGTIGDAALGLPRAQERSEAWKLDAAMRDHLVSRYRVPQPRIALAEALRAHATAAMDVSDGLVGDLGKLCRGLECLGRYRGGARAAVRCRVRSARQRLRR